MKTRFTPGPWRQDPDCDAYIIDNHFRTIAKVWPTDRVRVEPDEDKANARLIAAAPLMYQTLEVIQATFANWDDARKNVLYSLADDAKWFRDVREAIDTILTRVSGGVP